MPSSTSNNKSSKSAPVQVNEAIKLRGVFSKTRLCQYHQRGKCVHGADCQYAHDSKEVRTPPDLKKTTLCENFLNGECRYSEEECRYAHGASDLKATDSVFKTALCRFWLQGKCSLGSSCRHAHGTDEIRDKDYMDGMMLISHLLSNMSLKPSDVSSKMSHHNKSSKQSSSQASTALPSPKAQTTLL
jgi:Zinc finger C-x8-C-x5-C-x3-H type (and similar)